MTKRYSRLLALFLVLCLGFSGILDLVFTAPAQAATTYGMVINSSVRLRKEASEGSAYWFVLPVGWVCKIRNETTVNGKHWYRVIAPHPDSTNPATARTYWGYIQDAYFRPLTASETSQYKASNSNTLTGAAAAPAAATVTAAPAASGVSASLPVTSAGSKAPDGTTGSITNGGTNFREGPGKNYRSLLKLDRGTVVNITSYPSGIGENYWYGVSYAGLTGYVNSEFIRLISGNGSGTVTVSPTASPTPPPSTAGYNAVQLITTSAHMRNSPNGTYDRDLDWVGIGAILPLSGTAAKAGGYTWYPVLRNGKVYYVRNDCVKLVSSSSVASVTATPAPGTVVTPTPSSTSVVGYVKTIKGGCNLRATPAGTTIRQIAKGRTLPYLASPITSNGYTWYYVEVDGHRGYLRSDVVKVSGGSETVTAAPVVSVDPTAAGYLKTTASDVNLRTKAGYSPMLGRVAKGTVMPYYGNPTTVNGVTWYHVYNGTLGYGYIHGSYVAIVNADGSATPTPLPTAAPTGAVVTGSGGSQTEASYSTLKIGSTGTAVKNLVDALKNRGYYSGASTSQYTSAVEKAVKNFQRASGLSVDGIAGSATQHALYGTVPVGASDSSNLTMTLYPAEKVDWWTGGINELWAKGANYKVYDVKTGIVWWAHRWSGGYHVDAEPLTAADTARLCKAYGVTSASEIQSKNLYQRRPSLVTIGNRTFACSLYGVPHNYPEGDTISTNDFKGQVCIHFTNSWTHGSKKVDSLHTDAIQYA